MPNSNANVRKRARRAYRARLRSRPYQLKIRVLDASNDTDRQTILSPGSGRKVRFTRVKVLQVSGDGRHLWELFFGDAGNMITAPNKAVDVLAIPDSGSAETRVFRRNQGPRGGRDEVLSGRWRGTAPTTAHKIIVEYTEET